MSATKELAQMLAQDNTDKDAPAGGSQPGGSSALVDLKQGATFECKTLLCPKTALGNQGMAKSRQDGRKEAIDSCWNAILTMSPGSSRCGKQALEVAERAYSVDIAREGKVAAFCAAITPLAC